MLPFLLPILGSAISGAVSLGTGISNTVSQYKTQQYNRDLQNQIFEREDNAVQRRVADLEKSGFSKWNAITNPAATTTAFSEHSAPQTDLSGAITSAASLSDQINNALLTKQKIKESDVEIQLNQAKVISELLGHNNIKLTGEQLQKIISKLSSEKTLIDYQAASQKRKNEYDDWYYGYNESSGTPPDRQLNSKGRIKTPIGDLDISLQDLFDLLPPLRALGGAFQNMFNVGRRK